jgi:universal stress protein A
MGTHGRKGIDRILFGSTAAQIVRFAPCPVLTVRLPMY